MIKENGQMQQHIGPQQGNNWTTATLSHHKKEIQKALNQFTVSPYSCILTQTPKQHKALKQGWLWPMGQSCFRLKREI